MAFSITGQIKVATLKQRFLKEFGLTLRVYDGRSFADEGQTISQIRKKKGSGDLSVRKSMKVGTLEEKIESEFGIKVQIAGSDDSYLCKNESTLAQAQEEDQKRINKKDKKSKAVKSDSPTTDKENENTVDKTSEVKGGKGDVKIIILGRRITTFSFACLDDKYVEEIKKAVEFTDGLNEENLLHSILNSTIGEDFEDLKSEVDLDKIKENCPTLYKLLNKLEHSNLPESDKIEEFITPYPEPILYMESGHLISITIDGETKVDEQPLGEFLNINESIVLDEIEDEEDLELENSMLVQKAKEFCNEQKETLGLDPEYTTVYKCNNGMMLIEGPLNQPELVKMQKNENQITISGEVRGYVNFYLNDTNFDLDKLTFVRNDNYSEWIASDIVGNYLFYDNKKIKEYDFDQHNIFQLCDYGGSGNESLKFYLEG